MQDLSKLPSIEFAYELIIEPHGHYWTRRERLWSIYMIQNQKNRKMYIGRTTNPKQRAMSHFSSIHRHDHKNITDYEDEFIFKILADKLKWQEASEKEFFYMKKFKSYEEKYGYNTKDTHFYQKGKPTVNLRR